MGDIGLMGAPAKLDGKAVEGVKIFLGGKIGENPEVGARTGIMLAAHVQTRHPCSRAHAAHSGLTCCAAGQGV